MVLSLQIILLLALHAGAATEVLETAAASHAVQVCVPGKGTRLVPVQRLYTYLDKGATEGRCICSQDPQLCPSGVNVFRQPDLNCQYPQCPCANDLKMCPNGLQVRREPDLQCQFRDCPEGCGRFIHQEEICPDGTRLTRLPNARCAFPECPSATTTPPQTPGPTLSPTPKAVTPNPTLHPTMAPTSKPSSVPTLRPTAKPTLKPTNEPTVHPTSSPTLEPTADPTFIPTQTPTLDPTSTPPKTIPPNITTNPETNYYPARMTAAVQADLLMDAGGVTLYFEDETCRFAATGAKNASSSRDCMKSPSQSHSVSCEVDIECMAGDGSPSSLHFLGSAVPLGSALLANIQMDIFSKSGSIFRGEQKILGAGPMSMSSSSPDAPCYTSPSSKGLSCPLFPTDSSEAVFVFNLEARYEHHHNL